MRPAQRGLHYDKCAPAAPEGPLLCPRGACCSQRTLLRPRGACYARGAPAALRGCLLRSGGACCIQGAPPAPEGLSIHPDSRCPDHAKGPGPLLRDLCHSQGSKISPMGFNAGLSYFSRTPNSCLTASSSLNSVRCVRALSELSKHQA